MDSSNFSLSNNFIKYTPCSSFNKFMISAIVRRIEWAVLNWNISAIKFYESNGAKVYEDWHIAQMDEKAINNLTE